jgi:hypothetical protein
MLKLLSKGNAKLDKSVLGWSITPVKSCLNCSECKKDCYALGPYRRYPNVKTAWDRNFDLAKSGEFLNHIVDQLSKVKKPVVVRIHVAGDFFSQRYINAWSAIANQFSHIKFYTYTKVSDKFDFTPFTSLDNTNLIDSIAFDGGINFGDQERVDFLVENGYTVCPATQGKDVICGGNKENSCTICHTNDKVCFIKH